MRHPLGRVALLYRDAAPVVPLFIALGPTLMLHPGGSSGWAAAW